MLHQQPLESVQILALLTQLRSHREGGSRGQSATPASEKIAKNWEKSGKRRGKSGKMGKNWKTRGKIGKARIFRFAPPR